MPRLVPHKITTMSAVLAWCHFTPAVQNQIQGNLCYWDHWLYWEERELSSNGWDVLAKHRTQAQSWQFEDMMRVTSKCTPNRWASQAVTTGFSCSPGSVCGSSSVRQYCQAVLTLAFTVPLLVGL